MDRRTMQEASSLALVLGYSAILGLFAWGYQLVRWIVEG